MARSHNTAAEAALIGTLRRSSRRLARREALGDVLGAVPVAFLLPILVTVWRLVAPVPNGAVLGTTIVAALGYLGYAVWRLTRPTSLARAAAELDREADLHDALQTAEWFVRQPPDSPWVSRQLEEAAQQASTLDVARLVPVRAPRELWARAALVLTALAVLNVVPPLAIRALMTPPAAEHPTLTAEEVEAIKEIRELLAKTDLPPETRRRLSELLDMLEANELRPDETLEALNEAQELLGDPNGGAEGQEVSTGEEPQAGEQKPDGAKPGDAKNEPSETSPQDGQPKDPQDARNASDDAREAASDELRKVAESVEARQKNQEQRAANEQATSQKGQQSQDSSEGGDKPQSSSDGDPNSKQSASNAKDPSASDKSGAGADPSSEGDGQGALGDPTKLDVTLKRAAISTEIEPEILTPKELIEKDTRAGTSKLQYEDVSARTRYDEAEPIGTHEIPWTYRETVKAYFEAVGTRGTHDHD